MRRSTGTARPSVIDTAEPSPALSAIDTAALGQQRFSIVLTAAPDERRTAAVGAAVPNASAVPHASQQQGHMGASSPNRASHNAPPPPPPALGLGLSIGSLALPAADPRSSIQRQMLKAHQLHDEGAIVRYLDERLAASFARQERLRGQATPPPAAVAGGVGVGAASSPTPPPQQQQPLICTSPEDVRAALDEMAAFGREAEETLRRIDAMAAEFQSSGFLKSAEKEAV